MLIFPPEIESVFFGNLLPNSKPITVGTIYRPPNQLNCLEVRHENKNKMIQSVTKFTFLATLTLI